MFVLAARLDTDMVLSWDTRPVRQHSRPLAGKSSFCSIIDTTIDNGCYRDRCALTYWPSALARLRSKLTRLQVQTIHILLR